MTETTAVIPLIIGAGVTLGTLKLITEMQEKREKDKEKSRAVV